MDRNLSIGGVNDTGRVALRKESVDRNNTSALVLVLTSVALRKESVDRNIHQEHIRLSAVRRSPQGERG